MAQLSDQDIRDAAAEAGISPAELRKALAEEGRNLPAIRPGNRGLMAPSHRGASADACETALPFAPEQAARTVTESIERRLGKRGHRQSETEADILDEDAGVVYHVRAETDDAGGALVRVDIDATPRQGRRTLSYMAVAGATVVLGMVGFFTWPAWVIALGVGAGGTYWLSRQKSNGVANARAIAAEAIFDAESRTPVGGAQALPPAEDS
jgi:hypothetical protein